MSTSRDTSPFDTLKKPTEIKAAYYLVGKKITATLINPFGDGENRQYEANKPPLGSREDINGHWIETDQGVDIQVHSMAPVLFDLKEIPGHIFIYCKEPPSPPIGNFPLPNRYFSIISDIPFSGRHEHTNGVISIVSLKPGQFQGGFEVQKDSDGKGVDIINGQFDIVFSA
ncbi:hypothetical protein [Pseudomonas frederiksbergensis]|uniref:Uncharacterized protein n=1 Tax=Pseudomonas frederiksbergensis TaxID=104087 RepID=A0A6L5BX46_9PSED|nr:hypothetical protein [Pseudomonas frederiksbergensis]KAF2392870.1 hypothetical protein FX983_00831 [Pseudomonas frederiksbergensis]